MAPNVRKNLAKAFLGREAVKLLLRPLLHWTPLTDPAPGYSIILGVPWHLRELLPVNLMFLARTDLANCHRIHVVFDRRHRPTHDAVADEARRRYPELPLSFHHYPPVSGRIIEATNVSTFYNSMNCAVALADLETRWAILHDFDLYPLVPEYFAEVHRQMMERDLRFCGLERTHFDGLTDADNVLGTWCLGMDAAWLREKYRPINIFHRVQRHRGRWTTLDPLSAIELDTPERGLVGTTDGASCCHVQNLCATYLRYRSGQTVRLAWKLHSMWYLQAIADSDNDRLIDLADAMDAADGRMLEFNGRTHDFSDVDPTCANVLEHQIRCMEIYLQGTVRPPVERYVDATRRFLARAAESRPR